MPRIVYADVMEVVRLGKKGQLSLPKAVLRRLGLTGEALLLVDVTPEGGILLRPAGVYPIELYSQGRVREFLTEDRMTPQEARRVKRRIRPTA
ncbi:MAG: AbrB/MazE/SpoVT family DNA-binding domain-containing protein [bacterium]